MATAKSDATKADEGVSPENRKAAAELLGMKQSEIVDVVSADGGVYIQTHDKTWTFQDADGKLSFRVDAPSKRRS